MIESNLIKEDPNAAKEQLQLESINNLIEWRATKLNIGVLGASGGHKHSLIQKFTGHKEDPLEDSENSFELITPKKPVGHVHRNNVNIIFWELPECMDLKQNEYVDLVNLARYDLILICQHSSRAFDDNEILIAEYMKKKEKPVFFVKMHDSKDKSTVNQEFSDVDAIDRLEFQIIEKINDEYHEINAHPYDNFYTLSTRTDVVHSFDLNKLSIDILNSLNTVKMETLTFTIEPMSKEIIQKKHEILKSKTYHSAVISTVCGILTHIVPGMGLVVDMTFLLHEIRFYTVQFGLNEENLRKISAESNILYNDLIEVISKSAYASLIFIKDLHTLTSVLVKILPIFAVASATEGIKFFPVLGHIIHGSMSFLMTKFALIKILDEFSRVALDLNDLIMEVNNRNTTKALDEKVNEFAPKQVADDSELANKDDIKPKVD